ncbi:MAG: HU family DNA-binding protein [bacterium]
MNKKELVEKVRVSSGLTKTQTIVALDCMIDEIQKSLTSGEKVTLVGLGTFEVKPNSKSVTFKTSTTLKRALNEK